MPRIQAVQRIDSTNEKSDHSTAGQNPPTTAVILSRIRHI